MIGDFLESLLKLSGAQIWWKFWKKNFRVLRKRVCGSSLKNYLCRKLSGPNLHKARTLQNFRCLQFIEIRGQFWRIWKIIRVLFTKFQVFFIWWVELHRFFEPHFAFFPFRIFKITGSKLSQYLKALKFLRLTLSYKRWKWIKPLLDC